MKKMNQNQRQGLTDLPFRLLLSLHLHWQRSAVRLLHLIIITIISLCLALALALSLFVGCLRPIDPIQPFLLALRGLLIEPAVL